MNRFAHEASNCARKGVTRDTPARQQLMYEILDNEGLGRVFSFLRSESQARFLLERAPLPFHPHFPLLANGVTALVFYAGGSSELEAHLDVGGPAISITFVLFELVFRGGRSAGTVGSFLSSFTESVLGSFNDVFCGSWRSSLRWMGPVSRPAGVAPLPGGIPAHAGWAHAFSTSMIWKKFRGSLDFAQ